jgi:transcription elongation factor S-II
MSRLASVQQLKEALQKELPADTDAAVDRCRDLLQRLDESNVNLAILSDTMIGKTVSQLKGHASLGPATKALIKKWKQVAKQSSTGGGATAAVSTTTKPVPPKAPRRSSVSSDTQQQPSSSAEPPPEDFASELIGLLPVRQTICRKFFDIFQSAKDSLVKSGVNEQAIRHLLGPRALELEAAVWKLTRDKKPYTDKARTLAFNLKKNKGLTDEVILGQIEVDVLASMKSEELASAETRQHRAQEAKKLIDSKRLDWDQANEHKINEMCGIRGDLLNASLFTCGRCKSIKTTSTQKQTRSADEPMTVFVLCLNCGKRWKC